MAVRFDAATDTYSRAANVPAGNFTASFWVYGVSGAGTYRAFLVIGASASSYLWFGVDDSNQFHIEDNAAVRATGGSFSLSTWYHIVITASGTTATLYYRTLAGTSYSNINGSFSNPTRSIIELGSDDTVCAWGEHLNGRLANVKLWDGAVLTAAEFDNEREIIRPAYTANLSIWCPTFPGSGERNRDYSGNGRDWTVGGTLTDEDPPPVGWGAPVPFVPFFAAAASSPIPVFIWHLRQQQIL